MLYQNDRNYRLVIGDQNSGNAVVITPPLQLRFVIEKRLDNTGNINNATFEITNLSEETRTKFENIKYPYVAFECGYVNADNMAVVFIGHATSVSTARRGAEIVTRIEAGEGFRQLHSVLESFTVPQGKAAEEIVEKVVSQMEGISLGTLATNLANQKISKPLEEKKLSQKILSTRLNTAYPVEGTPFQVFNRLSKEQDIQWRLDRNKLYFRNRGGDFTSPEQTVFTISAEFGMVGLPTYLHRKAGSRDTDSMGLVGVSVQSLINPAIFPGSLIAVRSDVTQISGVFLVRNLTLRGDFYGTEWYANIEAGEVSKNAREP